jgi:hypothetical protein
MTSAQIQHQQGARANRTLLASVNHGRPDTAATAPPAAMSNRRESPNKMHTNAGRTVESRRATANPTPTSARPAPGRPEVHHSAPPARPVPRAESAPAHKSASERAEKPPANKTAVAHATAHPNNAHHITPVPKPAAPHSGKPAAQQPATQGAAHPSNRQPAHDQKLSTARPAPHQPQPRASAAHAAPPHQVTDKQPQPNSKPGHQDR